MTISSLKHIVSTEEEAHWGLGGSIDVRGPTQRLTYSVSFGQRNRELGGLKGPGGLLTHLSLGC